MGKKTSMLRKALAGVLGAAVFAGSVFTGTVFAVNLPDPASSVQITNPGGQKENSADHVTTQKTISGTDNENEFNITLTVTTQEELKEVPVSADTAVVLVMDSSGSMEGGRLTSAKKAAKNFVDKYVKDTTSADNRYAALVEFASDAWTLNNWINLAQGTKTFKASIDSLRAGGGTNIEAGLQLAYNLIQEGKKNVLKNCTNINVILLSDGCPTFHVNENTRTSTAKVEGVQGGGNVAELEDWQQAEAAASTIRNSGISLYSIAFATGTAQFESTETKQEWVWDFFPISGHYETVNLWKEQSVYDWMNGFSDKAFSAKDADKLSLKFENILNLITLGAKAWNVTDPMGANILYTGEASDTEENDTNKFTYQNGVLTWDLKNSTPQVSGSNPKTYTYTLTYPITLNTAADGFVSGQAYPTNGETVLTYYLFSKVNDDTTIPEEPNKMNFEIPEVKGYLGELSFTKNGADGALSGADFTLSMNGGSWEKEATSAADGTVTISGIPSGFTYTLTEEPMAGYEDLDPIDVKVSYGSVTDANNKAITTITNTPVADPATPKIIVVHDYGLDGTFTEDPIDYVADFQPTARLVHDGENYTLTSQDDPYEDAAGNIVYVLYYEKAPTPPQYSKIRVIHEYYTDDTEDGFLEEEFDYSEDFVPVQKPEYEETVYTFDSQTGPSDVGDGWVEYTLTYKRTTVPPQPPEPSVLYTMIEIKKTWDDAEPYDGNITFTATNENTGNSYTGTLRAGRTTAYIRVPSGGTYVISEDVPSGYTASYPDGDTVRVATGATASINVVNNLVEEPIVEPEPPLVPPTDPEQPGEESGEEILDEEIPLVNPPQTGSVASGISVLFGFAAAALVSSAVLRKKK